LEPQTAKPSMPEKNLVTIDNPKSIKKLSKAAYESRQAIVLNECPTEPCEIYYTDALSESFLIVCKSPKHLDNGAV
jgi:hypothetical protein